MTRLQDIQRQIRNLQAEERRIIIAHMPLLAKAREGAAQAELSRCGCIIWDQAK